MEQNFCSEKNSHGKHKNTTNSDSQLRYDQSIEDLAKTITIEDANRASVFFDLVMEDGNQSKETLSVGASKLENEPCCQEKCTDRYPDESPPRSKTEKKEFVRRYVQIFRCKTKLWVKQYYRHYFLPDNNGSRLKVCKTAFLRFLDVSSDFVDRTLKEKIYSPLPSPLIPGGAFTPVFCDLLPDEPDLATEEHDKVEAVKNFDIQVNEILTKNEFPQILSDPVLPIKRLFASYDHNNDKPDQANKRLQMKEENTRKKLCCTKDCINHPKADHPPISKSEKKEFVRNYVEVLPTKTMKIGDRQKPRQYYRQFYLPDKNERKVKVCKAAFLDFVGICSDFVDKTVKEKPREDDRGASGRRETEGIVNKKAKRLTAKSPRKAIREENCSAYDVLDLKNELALVAPEYMYINNYEPY